MTELATIEVVFNGTYSKEEKEAGKLYLLELLTPTCNTLYRQDVHFDVYLEDGSLKAVLIVAGSIYAAIGAYGSFRSGLDQLKKDAIVVASLLEADIRKNGIDHSDIVSIKRSARFSSKLTRLMNRIEKIEQSNLDSEASKKEISLIRRNIDRLIQEATTEADKLLVIFAAEEADKDNRIFNRQSKYPEKPDRPDRIERLFYIRNREFEELDFNLRLEPNTKFIPLENPNKKKIDLDEYLSDVFRLPPKLS